MNISQLITDRILGALKEGVIPWRKTWQAGLPKNLTTGVEYRGINILLLGMPGFSSRYWVPFREVRRLGGHVKAGEKGTGIIFWLCRTEDELEALRLKTGKPNLAPYIPFPIFVFNLDQVEGIGRPVDDVPSNENSPIKAVENFLAGIRSRPGILEGATMEPAYWPCTDEITMPCRAQFENPEHYYATLFRELVHSTGHSKRLNRLESFEAERGTRYSFQELVAEFGAFFLCGMTGIAVKTEEFSAAYIDGWAEALKRDEKMLLRAASAAQKAVDYLSNKDKFENAPLDAH